MLQARIRELGRTISNDYNGKEPLLVGILTGAVPFVSDLLRQISISCQLDFMATSSYGAKTESSEFDRFRKALERLLRGDHGTLGVDTFDTAPPRDNLLKTLKAPIPPSL